MPGRRTKTIGADRSGAALVEFALVAMPLLAMILGVLHVALTFFAQQMLETAAERSSRQLLTGQAQKAGLSQAQYKALVCGALPSFIDCSRIVVDVRTAASFAAASPPVITFDSKGLPSTPGQYQPGTAGAIVVAQIIYPWTSEIAPLGLGIGGANGPLTMLKATTVFRIENFQ